MKKILLVLSILVLASCARFPEESWHELQNRAEVIESRTKEDAPYIWKALQDSLSSIQKETDYQRSKFVLFRTYKFVDIRINDLIDKIDNGDFRVENFKNDKYIPKNERSIGNDFNIIILDQYENVNFPATIYILEIDGEKYLYSFRNYSDGFTVTKMD